MSNGQRIVVTGRLKGMNRDIPCKVSGIQTNTPGDTVFAMTDIALIDPPQDLPDGIYELDYEGSAERFTKHNGLWKLLSVPG